MSTYLRSKTIACRRCGARPGTACSRMDGTNRIWLLGAVHPERSLDFHYPERAGAPIAQGGRK